MPGLKKEIDKIMHDISLYKYTDLAEYNVKSVADAFKRYFRDLSEPPIPLELYDRFIEIQQNEE